MFQFCKVNSSLLYCRALASVSSWIKSTCHFWIDTFDTTKDFTTNYTGRLPAECWLDLFSRFLAKILKVQMHPGTNTAKHVCTSKKANCFKSRRYVMALNEFMTVVLDFLNKSFIPSTFYCRFHWTNSIALINGSSSLSILWPRVRILCTISDPISINEV